MSVVVKRAARLGWCAALALAGVVSARAVPAQTPEAPTRAEPVTAEEAGEAAPTPPAQPRVLDTVVVSGIQPGPGLWKVSKDGNVLWVLGTVTPLPRRMDWNTDPIAAVLAESSLLLLMPEVDVDVAGGPLRSVFLLPAALRARNNPQERTLAEVLPAPLHARWRALAARWLPRERAIEKRRPLVAAARLQEKAFAGSDLSLRPVVTRAVERLARRHGVAIERPELTVTIAEPKAALRELAASSLDDLDCFRATLDQVEHELETLQLRANAWALGDIDGLRGLPLTDRARACREAVLRNAVAERHGLGGIEARIEMLWLAAAERALATHASSVALLPMSLVLGADGWLAELAARGYVVEAPSR